MEQYTAKSNSSTEQIIVQAGQMQQQVQGQPLMVQVSEGRLVTTGQPIMVQALPGGQGQTIMQVPVLGHGVCSRYNRSHQDRSRSRVDRLCKWGQTQHIITQQPRTVVTAGQSQTHSADCSPGAARGTDCSRADHCLSAINADGTILQQGMITIPTANWQEHRLFIQKPTPTQPAVGKGRSL